MNLFENELFYSGMNYFIFGELSIKLSGYLSDYLSHYLDTISTINQKTYYTVGTLLFGLLSTFTTTLSRSLLLLLTSLLDFSPLASLEFHISNATSVGGCCHAYVGS